MFLYISYMWISIADFVFKYNRRIDMILGCIVKTSVERESIIVKMVPMCGYINMIKPGIVSDPEFVSCITAK